MIISNPSFQIVKNAVDKYLKDFGKSYNFNEKSIAFEFLVLEKMFNLQEDEIIESITDSCFQGKIGRDSNPDRGVDAIKIDEDAKIIHIFNFKYTDVDIDKVKDNFFSGSESDKVLSFIADVYQHNIESFSKNTANSLLRGKVEEIWGLHKKGIVLKYKIHFVSNGFKEMIKHEHDRFSEAIKKYNGSVSFDYILIENIVDKLIQRIDKINAKFRTLNTNYFEKSDYGRRAMIAEITAQDVLRMVSDSEDVRNNCDIDNPNDIVEVAINELAFSDNVRIYLKEKTNINKNIKTTALSEDESEKIFFYNNGITITCEKINYQNGMRNMIVSLQDLQVVNGGQTIHALRNAFAQDSKNFYKITLLCKIFETSDCDFKNKIAEYTNSQNPVNDRDIRSIDTVQIKLEKDFEYLGYFYERKKNQHEDRDKNTRIDAEKLGQALMAFDLEMPAEAKNKKSLIFGEKYENMFNDSLTARNALNTLSIYKNIEQKKLEKKNDKPFLLHSTYYVMFFIKKIAKNKNIIPTMDVYDEAVGAIEFIINKEKERLQDDYSDGILFKSNRPKEYLAELNL